MPVCVSHKRLAEIEKILDDGKFQDNIKHAFYLNKWDLLAIIAELRRCRKLLSQRKGG